VLEVAGISNALSKSLGSTNKINIAYATLEALQSVVPASKWLTRQNEADKAKKAPSKKAAASTQVKGDK
jgi:small subunit ribosomal protein S5